MSIQCSTPTQQWHFSKYSYVSVVFVSVLHWFELLCALWTWLIIHLYGILKVKELEVPMFWPSRPTYVVGIVKHVNIYLMTCVFSGFIVLDLEFSYGTIRLLKVWFLRVSVISFMVFYWNLKLKYIWINELQCNFVFDYLEFLSAMGFASLCYNAMQLGFCFGSFLCGKHNLITFLGD